MNKSEVIIVLQQYKYPDETYTIVKGNYFVRVNQAMIDEQEQRMKDGLGDIYYPFPDDLKEFWLNVGYGDLTVSQDEKIKSINFRNDLLSPEVIADIMLEESYHNNMNWDVFPGIFPCFNTSESYMFSMTMDGRIIFGTEDTTEYDVSVSSNIWNFYTNSLKNPDWYVNME